MKIWLLKCKQDLSRDIDPWLRQWDTAQGFVIVAKNETDAREIATKNACEEIHENKDAWTSPEYSTCVELEANEGLVLREVLWG